MAEAKIPMKNPTRNVCVIPTFPHPNPTGLWSLGGRKLAVARTHAERDATLIRDVQ
jgi:hypothetical protein